MINISPILETYLDNHANQEPEILARLRVETYQCTTQPHMISGEYQGRLLSLISKILFPKTILELGTFTGYATLCLAEGLVDGGKIITMDKNDELEYLCRKYFEESDYADKIDFRVNDAREELNSIEPDSVDLAFVDADKESYPYYFEKVLELLRPGGVMLVDNVLWYGKVMMEEEDKKDPSTKILKEFNDMVTADSRVESLILPIRDGITLIRKK